MWAYTDQTSLAHLRWVWQTSSWTKMFDLLARSLRPFSCCAVFYLFSSPLWPKSQSKQSCKVSQRARCVSKLNRDADGERSSWLVSDLSQLGMLSLSRNKSILCRRGCTWTISGSTISHQSTNRPLTKWSSDGSESLDCSNSWTRISEHVFKGRDCWGVHAADADFESVLLCPDISVSTIAWIKSSKSGEFVFLTFKQAEMNNVNCLIIHEGKLKQIIIHSKYFSVSDWLKSHA